MDTPSFYMVAQKLEYTNLPNLFGRDATVTTEYGRKIDPLKTDLFFDVDLFVSLSTVIIHK